MENEEKTVNQTGRKSVADLAGCLHKYVTPELRAKEDEVLQNAFERMTLEKYGVDPFDPQRLRDKLGMSDDDIRAYCTRNGLNPIPQLDETEGETMYQYKYVRLHGSRFNGANFEGHRESIDEHAKRGWRYVGYVPVILDGHGRMKDIDLIFERDTSERKTEGA